MDIRVNDVLLMKKAHPCGENAGRCCARGWTSACAVWAAGMRSCCPGARRRKNIRQVERENPSTPLAARACPKER